MLDKEFKSTWKQKVKQDKKCNICLVQNLTSRKTSTIMSMIKQMIETRAWKDVTGITENS